MIISFTAGVLSLLAAGNLLGQGFRNKRIGSFANGVTLTIIGLYFVVAALGSAI